MAKSSFSETLNKKGVSRGNEAALLITLAVLFASCTLIYYFGELVEWAGWENLRWGFFYSVHDVHRLFFLVPIIYAGYFFGVRAAIIVTIVSANTFLPRALLISRFPDPFLRMIIFVIIAGALGYLTAMVRRELKQSRKSGAILKGERDRLLKILEELEEGIALIGPDYIVRFTNGSMVKTFGDSSGYPCYKYLGNLDVPCFEICKLPEVIQGATREWVYTAPDGRTYHVLAKPFTDQDGTRCALMILK